jgi:hypothetical protein
MAKSRLAVPSIVEVVDRLASSRCRIPKRQELPGIAQIVYAATFISRFGG